VRDPHPLCHDPLMQPTDSRDAKLITEQLENGRPWSNEETIEISRLDKLLTEETEAGAETVGKSERARDSVGKRARDADHAVEQRDVAELQPFETPKAREQRPDADEVGDRRRERADGSRDERRRILGLRPKRGRHVTALQPERVHAYPPGV